METRIEKIKRKISNAASFIKTRIATKKTDKLIGKISKQCPITEYYNRNLNRHF